MSSIGANAIRVYHVDPTGDHRGCMSTFADAGIHLFVDLDTVGTYILSDTPEWTRNQYSTYTKVVDEFQQYNNTAGFFV
ncbi:hypothetical protein LTR16_006090, partial [Cryomyces antarcticus]